jgi:D-aspartate ligase
MSSAKLESQRDRQLSSSGRAPTAALVLGSDYRALGIVRSLGRRGVPVRVLASGDDRLASFSRYADDTVHWPEGTAERLTLLRYLAQTDQQTWALFPSADESAAFVSRHHADLAPWLVLTTPPWEVLEWTYDKRRTHELAVAAGVDHPWTIYPRSRAELEREELRFPLVLKPAVKPVFNRFTAAKAWRADDRATLLRLYDEACTLVDPDVLMVQELISGGGAAQLSYAALAEPGIAEPSRRLIAECGFSGLIEIEYKVDAATQRALLLDINPRVWGWHTLGARAGVDFSWLLWLRLCGETPQPVEARTGVRWVRLSTDLPTAVKEISRRRLPAHAYLASLLPPHEGAIFARDDPRPGLLEFPLLLRTLLKRVVAHGAV